MINYTLESARGAIKQIMKVRRLRSINFYNYYNYLGNNQIEELKKTGLHSVKFDVMSGYIDLYTNGTNGKCGKKIEDASPEMYAMAYNNVVNIVEDENNIPYKNRRSILVGVYR